VPLGSLSIEQQNNRPSLLFVHGLMIVAATLVSTSFTVGAAIARELDPFVLTLLRFILAAFFFTPIVCWRHGVRLSLSLFLRCLVISGCLVIFFCCMFLSLRYTSALNTSIIFTLVPSISGGYALLINGERLERNQLWALGCGMIATLWVVLRGNPVSILSMHWNQGDVIFLGGCLAMGLYTPLVKRLHRAESMMVMTYWVLITGCFWLLLFAGWKLPTISWRAISSFVWFGIVYLAIFTTIVTFFLTQYAVLFLGPTKVMAYSYLYPGLVIIIELVLGRGFPPYRIIPGVLVVLVAMIILQKPTKEKTCQGS
jgi:drug/metabolite transporter (DMT)-like permease